MSPVRVSFDWRTWHSLARAWAKVKKTSGPLPRGWRQLQAGSAAGGLNQWPATPPEGWCLDGAEECAPWSDCWKKGWVASGSRALQISFRSSPASPARENQRGRPVGHIFSQNQAVDSRKIASRMGNCHSSSTKGRRLCVVYTHYSPSQHRTRKGWAQKGSFVHTWSLVGFQVNPRRGLVKTAASCQHRCCQLTS